MGRRGLRLVAMLATSSVFPIVNDDPSQGGSLSLMDNFTTAFQFITKMLTMKIC
jgi:hypothetical protein